MKAQFSSALFVACILMAAPPSFADALEDQISSGEQAYGQRDLAAAEKGFDAVLKSLEKNPKADQGQLARVLNNLAVVYNETNRNPKAEEYYKRALAIREKQFGPNSMEVADTLNNLANLYKDQKNYAKAERLYTRSMAIASKLKGPNDSYMAMCNFNMGSFYRNQNKYEQAASSYKKALAIGDKTMGQENSHVIDIVVNLAEMYDKLGKKAEAKPLYDRYLKSMQPMFSIDAKDPNRLAKWKKVVAEMRKDKKMGEAADRVEKALSYQGK